MSKTQLSGVSGGHRSSWTWQHPHWQSHCAVLETDVVFHSNWTLWVGSRWYCLGCILYFSTLLHVCSWASFRFLHKWALPSWNQLRCSELLCTMPPSTAPWSLCNWTGWVRPHSHRAWSTVKQRHPGGSGTLLALPKTHLLNPAIIQESRWDTNHRSKGWLCLSVLPGKTLQLGQLRTSLVTAYKPFLLGFQQWVSLPSGISEHYSKKKYSLMIQDTLWDMGSNPFKDTTLLFSEMLLANCSFLKVNSKNNNVLYILLLLIFDILFN